MKRNRKQKPPRTLWQGRIEVIGGIGKTGVKQRIRGTRYYKINKHRNTEKRNSEKYKEEKFNELGTLGT